jgi:protein-L-isoaspartate(D-aspartate) O-methyltransferase
MQDKTITDALPKSRAESFLRRQNMVDCQIRTFDVTDPALIARFLEVPRENFLPAELEPLAYSDIALELRPQQALWGRRSLLPPLILARLLQGARLGSTDKVLDVASGTGYTAALIAGLVSEVVALESEPALCDAARLAIDSLGLQNVRSSCGELAQGVPGEAPFDTIFVNGATEANLETLFGQLKSGGRLIAIQRIADDPTGRASKGVRFEKIGSDISTRILFDASAPLLDAFRKAPEFVF